MIFNEKMKGGFMQTKIYCRELKRGTLSFYLNHMGNDHFLFWQHFKKGTNDYYKNGVSIDEAIDYSKAQRNRAVFKTMDKILMYIKYIEKESNIRVLNKTKAKNIRYLSTKRAANIA